MSAAKLRLLKITLDFFLQTRHNTTMKNKADKHFWALIAEMGWACNPDYKTISRNAYAAWGKGVMTQLKDFVDARVSDLGKAVEKYEKDNLNLCVGSDDSFSDIRYHVVGLGKYMFETCRKNPDRLASIYSRSAYTESFAYCFHEPEPERTEEEKTDTLSRLIVDIQRLDSEMDVLANKLDVACATLSQLVRLSKQVAEDCKNNS